MGRRFHRLLAFALTLPALVLSSAAARAEGPFALEDAVRLALATNERSLKAPLRVRAAEGQLEKARAAFLPTVVASGTGTLKATPDRAGRILAGTGQVTLTQPIFNLPAFPLYSQARHQLESERWGAVEDRRALAYDTAHAFLVALTDEHLVEAAQRRLERARANQQDAQARAEAQLTSTNDVTRARIETAAAEIQLANAQGNLEHGYLELGFLVGRPVAGPLTDPDAIERAARHGTFRKEDVIRLAESRRPDVRSAHERTEALRAGAREPLYRTAPTLAASAQLRTTIEPVPPDLAHDESAFLTLSWTMYDAGARYGDDKTRGAQAESQALDERALTRSIAKDVGIALAALRAAREAERIANEAVAAAKQNSEETAILYKQGLARAIELTDANAARYDAEVNIESAQLSMMQAYLGLREALGLDPVGDELAGAADGGAR